MNAYNNKQTTETTLNATTLNQSGIPTDSKFVATSSTQRSVKFSYKDEMRRFKLTPEITTMTALTEVITSILKLSEDRVLTFQYLDDEDDWITFDNDIELDCALALSGSVLRLSIKEIGQDDENADTDAEPKWMKFRGRGRRGRCHGGPRGHKGGRHCGKWKKWHKRSEDEDDVDGDVNDAECEDTEFGDDEPKWMKFKGHGRRGRFHGGHGPHRGHRGKWRKHFDDEDQDVECADSEGSGSDSSAFSDEPVSKKYQRRGRRGHKGKRHWRNDDNEEKSETSSQSPVDTTLTLEEIKSQINVLFESKKILKANLDENIVALKAKRVEIQGEKRSETPNAEKIVSLRNELVELRQKVKSIRQAMKSTQSEIRSLRQLAKTKN